MLDTKVNRIIYVACVTVFLTSLGCWVLLAYQDAPLTEAENRAVMNDERFAKQTAEDGLAEIKLGQLAQMCSSSETVKSFAQRMVVEHGVAADRLKAAVRKEPIALPYDLSTKDEQVYDRLSKLSGSEFDRAYAKDMIEDHQKDLAAFQREVNNGRSENIKTFAAQTVPMIQEHLNQARDMMKAVSPATSRPHKSTNSVHASGR